MAGAGGIAGVGGIAGAGTGGVGGGVCDLSGTWAAYASIPVQWDATAVLSPGVGNLQAWWLILRTSNGPFTTDIGQLCGIVLPSIGTVLQERHGLRFLADTTEHLPQFRITGMVSTQDATLNTDPAAVAFGVSLANPLSDPWPPVAELVQADDDLDGSPGVTTPVERGIGFADPLVELSSSLARANVMHVASRSVVVMRGNVLSCDEIIGALEVTSIDGSPPVLDGAIIGCRLSETGEPCSPSQAAFIDTNAPSARPTGGGGFVQVRVPDGATCSEVRGMYPAL
jgi:hypothetical protein